MECTHHLDFSGADYPDPACIIIFWPGILKQFHLASAGFANIYMLAGGIKAWKDAGLPLVAVPA